MLLNQFFLERHPILKYQEADVCMLPWRAGPDPRVGRLGTLAWTQAAVVKGGLGAAGGVGTGGEHLPTASAANRAALDEVWGLVSGYWTVCSLSFPFQKVDALQSCSEVGIGETQLLHEWLSEV